MGRLQIQDGLRRREIVEFLGCLDLPIKRARAAAWHRFEPTYYRLHLKLKGDVFY
jgi:hypothetical protein